MGQEETTHRPRRLGRTAAAVLVLGLVVAGLATGIARRRDVEETVSLRQVVMTTFMNIAVVTRDADAGRVALQRAFERVRRVEALMNAYAEDSEVARANREAAGGPVPLSPETALVVRRALDFSRLTGGAFDATVGPLVQVWRAAAKAGRLPDDRQVAAAREATGFRNVAMADDGSVRFERAGVRLDMGGIAKGYAADLAYAALREQGFPNALVAIGGEVVAGGRRPDGRPWMVGVQDPRTGPDDPPRAVAKLRLSNRAVSTSGNYRRFSVIEGRRISHIVDPATGQPAEAVDSVTIVAADGLTADALATGVSVMGVEKGLGLVNSLDGVEALLMTVRDDRLVFHRSRGMAALEVEPPPGAVP